MRKEKDIGDIMESWWPQCCGPSRTQVGLKQNKRRTVKSKRMTIGRKDSMFEKSGGFSTDLVTENKPPRYILELQAYPEPISPEQSSDSPWLDWPTIFWAKQIKISRSPHGIPSSIATYPIWFVWNSCGGASCNAERLHFCVFQWQPTASHVVCLATFSEGHPGLTVKVENPGETCRFYIDSTQHAKPTVIIRKLVYSPSSRLHLCVPRPGLLPLSTKILCCGMNACSVLMKL